MRSGVLGIFPAFRAAFRGALALFSALAQVNGVRAAFVSCFFALAVFAVQAAALTHSAAAQTNAAADTALQAEIQKTLPDLPDLAVVRQALAEGANSNATVVGLPLLFEAGRRGHADVVSVLVTFGVNVSVKINTKFFPEYMSENGLDGGAPPATGKGVLPWRDAAEVVIHFGEALKVFALTSTTGAAYNWNAKGGKFWPLDYLHHRYGRFDSVKNYPATVAAVEAMAGYMLDQGSPCIGYVNHPICTSRPRCPTTGEVLYSCSECAGYPHLSANGAACVADGECPADSTLNTAVWPASQCECDLGDAYLGGGCPSLLDPDLVAEVEKTEPGPVLSSVLALLGAGANPNATVTGGLPLLFEAGRRGHADIVSVLVTFGVNASVKINNQYFPEYMSQNGLDGAAPAATGKGVLPWRDAAEVVIHFGEALKVFALTSATGTAYDWANTKGGNWPLDYLHHRYNKFDSVKNYPATVAAVEAMAGYMLDQGSPCIGYVNHPICTSRPTCTSTGGVLYSCSKCAEYPHLSVDGAACVADGACRADSTLNTEIWPSPQCECDLGDAYFSGAGGCPALLDPDLVAEVEKTEPGPVLSSVLALLGAGANPNATVTGGLPLLFEAGRRGHADIVSVLVTFGVNASVKINNRFFPEYMSENGLPGGADAATGKGVLPWRDAAEVVIHFGEALKVFALTSAIGAAYDWNVKGQFWPLDYLEHRYNKFDSVKNDPAALAAMEVMAGYMLDQDSPCNNAYINHPICTSRPECPAIGGSPYYTCSECAGYPHISADGAACVADGGCRAGASANAAAWPASQCECDNGVLNAAGECPDSFAKDLAAEVEKTNPVLSSVRALLNAGADPDAAWRLGVPLLLAAATLGHAQIVSVLVTAGANPQAADFSYYDLDVVQHAATPLDARAAGPRSLRASVLYHFGGGLDVRNAQFGDADFDWNREDRNGYRAMDRLNNATKEAKVTLAGEDEAVIDGMANYMLARGANCSDKTSAGDRAQGVCVGSGQVSLVRSSLFAELEKAPPETADISVVLRLLGEEGGHPDIENSDRRPLLILAARQGHADLVSILVTLGANVNAEDGTFHKLNVAHHMATPLSDPAAGPRSLRASVLYHFSGALDVRNARSGDADFDWNKPDGNTSRALDILAAAENKLNLEGENVTVIYEMAEHMIGKGAECSLSDKLREVCIGRLGVSLAAAVKDPNTSADEVRAAVEAMVAAGISINVADNAGILAAAAESGHAAAVSVLLTFGVNPDGRGSNNRGVLHFVGQSGGSSAPTQLQVLRHFIGGLEVAGKTDSFNGWNAGSGVGRPLDALQNNGVGVVEALAERREIHALLYERGARCATPAEKTYCQIPADAALIPAIAPSTTGPVLTITATRRAFGGASFDLRLPDAGALAMLNGRGWGMERVAGPPSRVVVSRTRALLSGDDLPAVAVTMVNGEHAARQIHVIVQADVLPLFVTVVGSGSVSILAGGQPLDSGSIPTNLNIQIIAEPDNLIYHVSGWGGPCASAPKGADSGGSLCEFIFNGKDNRVTVTFGPGRLGPYVPASGNLPDSRNLFKDTGVSELIYFCRLFGGTTENAPSNQIPSGKPICHMYSGKTCDSPGYAGFAHLSGCGGTIFRHIRDCNANNEPAPDGNNCGAPCDAAKGMVARGKTCKPALDECVSLSRMCDPRASCNDPDATIENTPTELCTCNNGFTGDGITCGDAVPTANLLAAALTPGKADVTAVAGYLSDGANPNIVDENGVPVLVAAAKLGRAEIVSVLVTAGADPNVTDPTYYKFNVAHHLAAHLNDPAAGPRSLRASVLYYFSAALDVRNAAFGDADFEWNAEGSGGNRALDLLVNATAPDKITLAGEDLAVIHEMAEHMLEEGARCGYRTSNKLREVCLGSAGLPLAQALIETVKDPNIPAADVRAAAQAAQASGIHLDDDVNDGGGHILAVAAQSGHAAAVSILLTFGVNPDGRISSNSRGVLHIVGRNSDISAPLQLRVLRHFIAGLDAAGKADSFNGWNASSDIGSSLDALQNNGAGALEARALEALAEKREIHALLYERGARCGSPGSKIYCQIPAETLLIPANLPNTGAVLTVTARDFGGTSFDLQLPDGVAVATMSLRGWEMTLPAGSPARVVLSRTRAWSSGDEFPTVAVTMLNGEQAVRQINIAGQSGLTPFFVTVVGSGSVSIVTNGKPIQSGGSVLPNHYVKIIASPDSLAYHVSLWSGPCAAAPKGADGGERTCEFIFNGEDNRVTVSFSPGRLARHLPASGNVPDSRYGMLADTKTNALDYFCGLFGGGLEFRVGDGGVARPICFLFGHILAVNGCDSAAGGYGNVNNCGSTDFKHIRDCNAANKPVVNRASCGAPCDAAAGMVAFGKSCVPVVDQCAASSSSPCAPRASCSDRDVVIDNTPAELCACNNGLAGDGVTCGERAPTANLLAEALKTSGEADANVVAGYLSAGANPNIADENGVPALVAAAKLGRAEIVSVLVTAGADPNAKDPTFHDLNVAQHMATPLTDPAAGPRDARASVLYHFSAALDVRNTMFGGANFDWNREDRNGHRALDILVLAEDKDPRPDGEDERVIYEMAEHMIDEGARCGNLARNKMRAVCLGTLGVSLMAAAQDPNTSAVEVRALAQAMLAAGARPDNVESASDGGHVLAAAAASGNAAAVSVLLTFRVNPDRRDADNRGVPHLVGRNSGSSAPLQLQILRHFIGGLGAAGKADSFNGWNASSDLGRPLDALQNHAPIFAEGLTAKREIQALLYERGARCASPEGKTYCQIPAETALIPSSPPDTIGPVLTVTARDFGGTFFDLQLPDAAAVAAMSLRGWRMDRFYGPPRRVELSRTRPLMPGDDFPTVAVTMLNGEQAVRRINIASQSAGAPFIVTVIGQGSVSIAANGAPIQNGGTILQHYHVEIVATPDSAAYHVSDWSGPCATARKGADGGERTCDLIFNEEDNRVTVTFSPGRLGLHLPATGYIPDGPVEFKDTGKTELAYFCGLLGGTTTERVSETSRLVKDVCQTFGGIAVYGRCDSPGQTAGFDDRPDCGGSYFSHIRGCNAQNKPATSTTACGAACNAAMGMVARGRGCASVSDQCAASPAPACHADAACADPDVFSNDAPAELCACNRGFHGDGLSCRSTTPTIERFPFFVTVVGQGAVRSIRAGGELIQSGQSIQANLGVEIVAAPGRAYHVSDWTGPCAAAPKGADGGERTCEFFFNPETNRVTVTFSPGRLAPTLPASGDVPDGPTSFENVGASELAHFCRLLGGRTNSVVSKGLTKVLCVMPGFPNSGGGGDQCDSPGIFGFDANVDNCGPHVFGRIRDCNVENKPGLSHSACGAACDAAAGMAARGLSCQALGDQCAAPFPSSGCDAQAVCSDPDVELTNTPAELCTCTGGLAGDGVACGQQAASAGLLAEVKKPAGAANVSMVLTLLGFGANADIADGNGDAALIIAATLGHAEIVSVLVTAGANVNARWNSGNPGRAVPHIAAINNFGTTLHYPWKTALNVLRHFADAVNQKGATYNWNSNGGGPFRAIELLEYRYSNGAAVWGGNAVWPAESVSVKYEAMEEMTEILLENGEDCRDHVAAKHITCQGSFRAALADVVALGAIETSAADVRAAAQTVIAAGINLRTAQRDAGHNGGGYVVAIAAARGHAEAVSILVTFGADAGGKTSNDRAALHHIGRGSGDDAPGRLTVLRYFIGGLRAAGKLDTFAGWNAGSGIGFPLDVLQNYAPKNPTNAAAREIQKLLWEGGSRCGTPGAKTYCQIPREERLAAAYSAGSGLTVRGRDFRGTVFVFSPLSAELNMSLAASGWRTTLESSEEEFLILRTREPLPSDTPVEFTVTAFAGAGGDAVRVYDIEAAATATVGVSYKTVPEDGSRGRVSASGEGLIGSNAVYAGSRVTFTATPESGHGVFAWETNGADCPRGALKCVAVAPVDSDLLVTARFEPTYPAGYGEMPNDKTGGTLTAEGLVGEDRVFSGTTVTFRARPAAGWLFSAWQGDGAEDCLPSNLECELPAGNDGLFVTVQFTQGRLVEYQADPSDESGGTLTVAGLARDNTALAGALVTFTASPAPGWELSAWEGDVSGCVAPNLECILPADDDLRVTAVFLQSPQIRYEANPPDESGGSVTVLGVDGNAGGVDFVYSGGTVTFTATLELGWELSAWEGCSSSGLECELTVNDDVQVTAHFSQAPRVRYAANPSDESGGRVMVAGVDGNAGGADFVYSGGTVTFTATPAFGWEVSAWEGDVGDCVAPALECEAAANMDLYVTVGFSRVTVRVEAANIPAEGGSVTVQLPGLDYAFLGSDVTFTATPADGWYAAGWEGLGTAGCAGLECVVMIATEADVLVTVRFAEVEAQTVRVEYASDPPYAGQLSVELPGLDFAFLGATVTFTATPANHWLVEGWSGEGTAGCSGLTCEAVADGDLYVTVRFTPVVQATVAVAYETVPEGGGGELTVELPGGNFAFAGVTVTFKATPMPGWTIAAWEGDAIVSCSASSLTCVLVAGSDLVVGVRFRQYDCAVENREGSGSACGACKAGYGEMGIYCVEKATGDFGIAPQSEICRALQGGGEAAPARLEGDGELRVCSGVDKNDTFCILDSKEDLPCRGLFRHVLRCNVEFNRPALNPFFCGKKCDDDPSKPRAVGGECRP